jgi:hypothetical protein
MNATMPNVTTPAGHRGPRTVRVDDDTRSRVAGVAPPTASVLDAGVAVSDGADTVPPTTPSSFHRGRTCRRPDRTRQDLQVGSGCDLGWMVVGSVLLMLIIPGFDQSVSAVEVVGIGLFVTSVAWQAWRFWNDESTPGIPDDR